MNANWCKSDLFFATQEIILQKWSFFYICSIHSASYVNCLDHPLTTSYSIFNFGKNCAKIFQYWRRKKSTTEIGTVYMSQQYVLECQWFFSTLCINLLFVCFWKSNVFVYLVFFTIINFIEVYLPTFAISVFKLPIKLYWFCGGFFLKCFNQTKIYLLKKHN